MKSKAIVTLADSNYFELLLELIASIKKYKEIKKDDAKVDHTQTPPTAVFVGEDNGTGRGTESTD